MHISCHTDSQDCLFHQPQYKIGFRFFQLKQGKIAEIHNKHEDYLFFVVSGKLIISFGEYRDCPVNRQELFYLPKGLNFRIDVLRDTKILSLRHNSALLPCSLTLSEKLQNHKSKTKYEAKGIPIKPEIWTLAFQIITYLESGLNCNHLHEVKQTELYLLFRHFYSTEEIVQLFYHSLGQDPHFTDNVLTHYPNTKTAQELAVKMGYGEKTFREIFKKNFGTTPYKWMQQQMSRQIQAKLIDKRIPLKQIVADFRFSTSSHFNVYCKRNFGATPMQIRKSPWLYIKTLHKPEND